MSRRYCVISPCRDEARFVERSFRSVSGQTEPPARWIVVDDGSTDETPELLEKLVSTTPFAEVLRVTDRGQRVLGAGVIAAFDLGLAQVDLDDFDYVVKLDLDLELPPAYFEAMLDACETDPRLASVSGKPFYLGADGSTVWEPCGSENSVGMAKFYRVEAFREIGGFVQELMWDGIDCNTARQLGWRTRALEDRTVAFEHLRPMGSSDRGILRGRRRHGRGQWYMGSSLPFVTASSLVRVRVAPAVVGSLHTMAGYLHAAATRMPRHGGPEFRSALRRYQRESLVLGKRRAIERWERRSAPDWARRHDGL